MFDQRTQHELRRLLERLCEDRLEPGDADRIEEIVLADRAAARFYLDYLHLHGSLHWDAAVNNITDSSLTLPRIFAATETPDDIPIAELVVDDEPAISHASPAPIIVPAAAVAPRTHRRPDRQWTTIATVAATVLVATLIGVFAFRGGDPDPREDVVEVPQPDVGDPDGGPPVDPRPIRIDGVGPRRHPNPTPGGDAVVTPDRPMDTVPVGGSSDDAIVAFIDEQLQSGYAAAEVEPSPRADDAEWVRRIHLDLVGYIPSAETVETFLERDDPDKRAKLVAELLDDPAYSRHFATKWTNLLVGRKPSDDVDRDSLAAYLRTAFGRNRPWDEVVTEIVAAEGSVEENGAANFLVAHLNDQAVPATAITAQLFLGIQVHCTQCHNHPFNDNWGQDQFWELNAFFKQTELVRRNGRVELVSEDVGGPTFYETRQGLMMVAYPGYEGRTVDPAPETNRRDALAKLMLEGDRPRVAEAIVNRMWAHFLGRGFTSPVDDMGPHNAPTHPALLERLSTEFVRSGYDVRRLVSWITNSEAYQRTSHFAEGNLVDAPENGETPLFSRVYVKPMTPEQVYDSLVMATWGDAADWQRTTADRDRWVRQYVESNETDENDENLALDGSVPQALAVMNGELTSEGTSLDSGTRLQRIVASRGRLGEKIRAAFVAALSREPTDAELNALRELLRDRRRVKSEAEGLQDLYWALLNSNEFVQVH